MTKSVCVAVAVVWVWAMAASSLSLPSSFDSRTAWPQCAFTILDQDRCGSCWAFSSSTSFADRLCIAGDAPSGTIISPEPIVDCIPNGCGGGWMGYAFDFFVENGTTTCTNVNGLCDGGCQPYTSGPGTNPVCPNIFECADHSPWIGPYYASSQRSLPSAYYNDVNKVMKEMMADIMTYGPLTAAFYVYESFFSYNPATEVYKANSGELLGAHAIKIIGWGTADDGTPYWLIANSWGPTWANQGYFKFLRGANLSGIENWATAVYAPSKPYVGPQPITGNVLTQNTPGGYVVHSDLNNNLISQAVNYFSFVYYLHSERRQAGGVAVAQSASTSVAAGVNYDMTIAMDGVLYHVLMFQNLQGAYSFPVPPQVIGTVPPVGGGGGGGGLTGGEIAAVVVCSVFGAALVVAAGVYVATRNSGEQDNGNSEGAAQGGEEDDSKWKFGGIPVLNHISHIRRVREEKHQSITARNDPYA